VVELYKSFLVTSHVFGVAIGLGTATIVDLILLRFLIRGEVTGELSNVLSFLSKIVAVGLLVLCFSGVGFLHHYSMFDQTKLANPKLVAKVSLVAILILNGLLIHRYALPLIRRRVGGLLLDGICRRDRFILLTVGAVSATTWYFAFLLGTVSQFNFGPSSITLFVSYLAVLAGTVGIALSVGSLLGSRSPKSAAIGANLALRTEHSARLSAFYASIDDVTRQPASKPVLSPRTFRGAPLLAAISSSRPGRATSPAAIVAARLAGTRVATHPRDRRD
jgi:hypothetical protein